MTGKSLIHRLRAMWKPAQMKGNWILVRCHRQFPDALLPFNITRSFLRKHKWDTEFQPQLTNNSFSWGFIVFNRFTAVCWFSLKVISDDNAFESSSEVVNTAVYVDSLELEIYCFHKISSESSRAEFGWEVGKHSPRLRLCEN